MAALNTKDNMIKIIFLKATYYFRIMILIIVKLLLNFTTAIKIKLERIKSALSNSNVQEVNFHTLTPEVIENNETIDFYVNSLNWAVQKDDCFNIALMGIYGSGKSTIIQSFFGKHDNYKKVLVSLANFENDDSDIGGIEKSIVQQIFYTVKESRLPNSGLKRIKNHHTWSSIVNYFVLCITAFLFTILIYPKILIFLSLEKFYNGYLNNIQLAASFSLLILCFFIYKKYRYFIQQLSVKFNLQNAEISLPSVNSKSIINEYLDELIYFFERNHCDIVVFEDLDRYKNKGIFSKLRELNSLLNNHETIKKKGKITFLYAIKDDIFGNNSSTTRTKFFDFILPVISVMNSSNSYAQIKMLLNKEQITKLSDEFLKGISLYINDLRLLKNICNEFTIYKTLINDLPNIDYSSDNFFAMVIYKNYFPSDFNNLLKDQGELYFILSTEYRQKLGDYYSNDIKNQLSNIQKQIDSFNNEPEQIVKIKQGLTVRKNNLEKINVTRMPLSELTSKNGLINFDSEDNSSVKKLNYHSIYDSELIQYLIKNGFLDENYQLYISHYIDGGLTKNDISFVLHVNEDRNSTLNYDFHLTFVPEILSRIHPNKFSSPHFLNYSLIDYLIEIGNHSLKKEIFQPISQLNKHQKDFSEKYLERGINEIDFIAELVSVNDKVLDRLIYLAIAEEFKSKLILDYLFAVTVSQVNSLLKTNVKLLEFISTCELLFDSEYLEEDKLIEFASNLNQIKIKKLNYSIVLKRLKTIEEENIFEINLNNITILYNRLFNPISTETQDSITPIFTKISDNWNPDSIDYFLNSKNFINAIYSNTEIIHNENEDCLLNLINTVLDNDEIEENSTLKVIFEKTSTIFSDINNFSNQEIQQYLILNNRLKLTWNNVISFQNNHYEEELQDTEIGEPLIHFIAKNTEKEPLDFGIEEFLNINTDAFLNFKTKILTDPRIEKVIFSLMLKTIDEKFIDQIEISIWDYVHIETLIEFNLIKLSNEWVNHLKNEEWDDLLINLYILKITELLSNYESFSISGDELGELLNADISLENKMNLFLKYDFIAHNYTNKVSSKILNFTNQHFNEITFNLQQMLPILKYTNSKDLSLSKNFAIKLIKQVNANNDIKEIILALNITEFNSLWDYSSNTQAFYNTKENKEIFRLLGDKELVGKVKPRKSDGKLQVYKKKYN